MSDTPLHIPPLVKRGKWVDYRMPIWGNSFTWSWERRPDEVKYVVIHHSVTKHEATPDDIALLHKARGWGGIGYHFVVTKDGTVYYVGDLGTARANVLNLNEQVIGICFPKGSNILANPEPKNIEKLKIGDKILSSRGNYQKITNTVQRHYSGELVKVKALNLPEFELTPEHPVLVANGELKWTKAKDLKENDLLVFPKLKSFASKGYIDLANYIENGYYLKRGGKRKKSYKLKYEVGEKYIVNKNGESYFLPRFIKFTEDFFRLCGWYLAEGSSMSKQKGIVFSLNGASSEVEKVNTLLKSVFNKEGKIYKLKGNAIALRFDSRVIYNFFNKEFGGGARNKAIPLFIINSSRKLLKSFLESYTDGDGHRRKYETTIVTASEKVAWGLLMVYSKLSILPSFCQRQARLNGKEYKQYAISIYTNKKQKRYFENKNNFFVPIKKLGIRNYEGYVYNIETEDNTYLAPVVVHNCMIGDFTKHLPSDDQIVSAHELCHFLLFDASAFSKLLDWGNLVGHKDLQATQCPGASWPDDMRQRIIDKRIYTSIPEQPIPPEEIDYRTLYNQTKEDFDNYKLANEPKIELYKWAATELNTNMEEFKQALGEVVKGNNQARKMLNEGLPVIGETMD
ncbi:MAG: N-acetylmuramoyl-L-alanine amidase, partial [Candidatus Pacebacteria bacterium]|nr:N-acetylmuramoyl-L-alanine amidase [Candidatus Paceibacterota bacterium]